MVNKLIEEKNIGKIDSNNVITSNRTGNGNIVIQSR